MTDPRADPILWMCVLGGGLFTLGIVSADTPLMLGGTLLFFAGLMSPILLRFKLKDWLMLGAVYIAAAVCLLFLALTIFPGIGIAFASFP
jgi:hypothetical protein